MLPIYKVRHDRDFSEELRKAKQAADFGVRHRTFSCYGYATRLEPKPVGAWRNKGIGLYWLGRVWGSFEMLR